MSADVLGRGLAELGLEASPEQLQQFNTYLEVLDKWNRVYNLTAIKGFGNRVRYHVLDSLSIAASILPRSSCLDVGSGAGLPGMPLAILLPQTQWVLLDSNGKKTRFMQQAAAACGVSNVKVVHARVEDYHSDSRFDFIVSRAYASIADFVATVEHLWRPSTTLLSMKTQLGDDEINALDSARYDFEAVPLDVPGINESRSLVTIKRLES